MAELGALDAFLQAAETRSFTEAGRRIGVSSSAVGRSIARLEQEMGARLFHRSTRAITLTAEGELLLQHCYRIFAELDAAKQALGQAAGTPRGRLKISLPQLGIHLMDVLVAFQLAYPGVELELDFGDRIVNVIEEGFDVVLRIGAVEDSRLTMRKLPGYRHHLVASPGYMAARGLPKHPTDLTGHSCLRYRYPTSGKLAPWPLKWNDEVVSVDVPQSAVANTLDAIMMTSEAGLGIASLPDFIVDAALAEGRLVEVLAGCLEDTRDMFILWPSARQPLPKVSALVNFMVAQMGRPAGNPS